MKHGRDHSHFLSQDAIADQLRQYGFTDVHASVQGTMPVAGVGRDEMECVVVWARAPE